MFKKLGEITRVFLIIVVAIVIVFDIIIVIAKGAGATISYQVWLLAKVFPFLPFAFGILSSHFFAPYLFPKIKRVFRMIIWITLASLILSLSITQYPCGLLHPFIWLVLGMCIGLMWAQKEIALTARQIEELQRDAGAL